MIDVKIDLGKMLQSLTSPSQQAQPPPQQQQQAQPPPLPEQQRAMEFEQMQRQVTDAPLDPIITAGVESYKQLKTSWDKVFGFLQ